MLVGLFYRPPNTSAVLDSRIEESIDTAVNTDISNIVLVDLKNPDGFHRISRGSFVVANAYIKRRRGQTYHLHGGNLESYGILLFLKLEKPRLCILTLSLNLYSKRNIPKAGGLPLNNSCPLTLVLFRFHL
ncbi:hypothetical protein MAR_027671 [Mya arenaria]|uniref:Uncharacterized protein n=1 Tax=Mya arenaria TaxID=6604 RepID=A0ABY7EXR2_MYAAR|nr:hypothetical protein MAR_027671 [Mya arenaria]